MKTGGRSGASGLSGIPNPNPRHHRHRPNWRRLMKHHLLDSCPPTHPVPRIIALLDPSGALCSFVKLEHVLPDVRVEEQAADASFCDMDWPLAALVSVPLLLHLRQHLLPVATVTPEVVNQNHVLAVGFSHELDDPTTSRSQSRRGEKVNTGDACAAPG
jgi:hypothetical protein